MTDPFTEKQIETLLVQRRYAKGDDREAIEQQLVDQGVTFEDVPQGVRWHRSES